MNSSEKSAQQPFSPGSRVSRWLLPLTFFVLMTIVHTWPLASDPAGLLYPNADVELNAWIVSWVAHELPHDPARLFDANIFYPDRRVLAFSEPLLPPGILAIVPRALGASAVLTHNLLLMLGFLLTGLAGCAVGTRFSGDRLGGLLAGSLVAFGPNTLSRMAHLQAHWLVTLPLSLLALDAVIRRRSWGSALGLGACLAFLAVTSGYGLAIGLVAVAAGWLARMSEWRHDIGNMARCLAFGALLSVLLASPVLLAYWRMIEEHGGRRPQDISSSLLTSFAWTPSRLHHDLWSYRFAGVQGGTFFPGFITLALVGFALIRRPGWKDPRARMLFAVAVAGALVSMGPATPLYGLFLTVFPPARAMRDISRFASLFVLAFGLLASMGLGAWRLRLTGPKRLLLPLLLIGGVNAEVLCAPFRFVPYDGVSPVYTQLAAEPARVALAEFPFYVGDADYQNASYALASTVHWTPLVNGYSGMASDAYERRAAILKLFPEPAAVLELQRLGVSHIIVHPDRARPRPRRLMLDFLDNWREAEQIATGPSGERLYRITWAGEERK